MTSPTRRGVLGAAAALTLGAPALVGCATKEAVSASNVGVDRVPWPDHVPAKVPEPDLPADPRGVDPAYFSYPSELVTSVPERPGNGETVTVLVETYEQPPAPVGENRFWQAINKALGVDLRLRMVPTANLQAKLATLMASGDMPDAVMCRDTIPRIADYATAVAQDLSGHLSGDAVREYPNLANLPGYAWRNVGLMAGRIRGVPIIRPRTYTVMMANREQFTTAMGGPYEHWTADQYLDALKRLAGHRTWGLGHIGTFLFGLRSFSAWHGAPNQWRRTADGTFVKAEAAPEFREAVAFARKVYRSGAVYPGGTTVMNPQIEALFQNQSIRSYEDTYNAYPKRVTDVKKFTVDLLRAPTGLGSGPVAHFHPGTYGYTILKKASPDRIRLILRIMNFLAAPFGTREFELTNYGVEGVHFTRTPDGDLELTDLAGRENPGVVPIKYITCPPTVSYFPGNPGAARRAHAYQTAQLPIALSRPDSGLISRTGVKKTQNLSLILNDATNAIAQGQKPVSAWDGAVARWRREGGDVIAEELQAEYEAVHGR